MNDKSSHGQAQTRIEEALQAARRTGADASVIDALEAARSCLAPTDAAGHLRARREGGLITRTFEDESFEPHGREFDVRVHYDWIDYSAGDAVTPAAGGHAVITDIEVIDVRYFDEHGRVIDVDQYHDDAATALAREQWEQLEEACTEQGARTGAGETSPLFFGAPLQTVPQAGPRRMAPSARQRGASHESGAAHGNRKLG